VTRSVTFRPDALLDLEDIHRYTVGQFGAEQARTYLDGLREAFGRLADLPKLGQPVEGVESVRVWVHQRRHAVIYREHGDRIEVARVIHGANDPELRRALRQARRIFRGAVGKL
jgi:toxin ParE1/3/4